MLFGWVVSIPLTILIIPLCYFALYFMEWLYEGGWGIPISLPMLRKTIRHRISKQLDEQSRRIKELIDALAERLEQQPDKNTTTRIGGIDTHD